MPGMSHQVNGRTVQPLAWRAIAAIAAIVPGGCAVPQRTTAVRTRPVCIPDEHTVPRVIVYGSLGRLRPDQDQSSPLERFLYGPDAGRILPDRLRNPQGMTLWTDRLLVCDQGVPELVSVDLSTGRRRSWGDADHPPRCPVDVASDTEGNVYVADTTLGAVLLYDAHQRFRGQLVNPAAGPFRAAAVRSRPSAVLVRDNTLYVGDVGTHTLARYDLARQRWLVPLVPDRDLPPLVAPVGLCATRDGVILVVEGVGGIVHRVMPDGQWSRPIGAPGRGPGQFVRPKHVCCTPSGLILVTDAGRQSVLVFDPTGRFLLEVAGGPEWPGFTFPAGIVALASLDAEAVMQHMNTNGATQPDECVIVSDTLSDASLTVLGVIVREPQEQTSGR